MSGVIRRVTGKFVGDQTATVYLECDHAVTLYRQIRTGRVTWCTQAGEATGLSTRSRECPTCTREAAEADAAQKRGWRE